MKFYPCVKLLEIKNIIVDELHKTVPILTKYEKTRILGERTKQINNGSKPFVDVQNDIIDGYLIACKELEEKRCLLLSEDLLQVVLNTGI